MTVNLDDVRNCQQAAHCAACGELDDLTVSTFETPVGVYCATVCVPCVDAGRYPKPAGWPDAVRWVMLHCEHLGIDADQMAAALVDEADAHSGGVQ